MDHNKKTLNFDEFANPEIVAVNVLKRLIIVKSAYKNKSSKKYPNNKVCVMCSLFVFNEDNISLLLFLIRGDARHATIEHVHTTIVVSIVCMYSRCSFSILSNHCMVCNFIYFHRWHVCRWLEAFRMSQMRMKSKCLIFSNS